MTKYSGKDGSMEVAGGAVSQIRSFEIDINAANVDNTVMGEDWEDHSVLQKSWTATVQVLDDPGDANQTALSEGDIVACEFFPAGETTGYRSLSGTASVESVGIATSYNGNVERSVTLKGKGALTTGAVA